MIAPDPMAAAVPVSAWHPPTAPAMEVIEAMGEIGASMETRYKETALGGLAATKTGQAIAKRVLIRDIEVLPDEDHH